MDTSKLITVTIWATLALIAYELIKSFSPSVAGAAANAAALGATSQSSAPGLNTLASLEQGTQEAIADLGGTTGALGTGVFGTGSDTLRFADANAGVVGGTSIYDDTTPIAGWTF